MKEFCGEDFLLENPIAKKLYGWASKMPITELWLKGDHYKWRQMRTCGI